MKKLALPTPLHRRGLGVVVLLLTAVSLFTFRTASAQEADHLADHAELREMASQRKPDRATQQQDDQDIRPEDVVDDADPFV